MTTPISQLAVPWADCQGESITDQLRHGVRHAHVRGRARGLPYAHRLPPPQSRHSRSFSTSPPFPPHPQTK